MSNTTSKPANLPTDALAEPGPDWSVARTIWGLAWGLHWIGFRVLFGLLAIHSFLALVLVDHKKGFCHKHLHMAINSMLFVLGATRAVYLMVDPYESRENSVEEPKWLTLLLFGIVYPCLTSSFCLIHLAFLDVTKLKVGPSRLQNAKFLSAVIFCSFYSRLYCGNDIFVQAGVGRTLDRLPVILHSLWLASLWLFHL